jgi:hypothetical protein
MTHKVQAQFAARDAHTLTEGELDTVSAGQPKIDNWVEFCDAAYGVGRALNAWNYALGACGY